MKISEILHSEEKDPQGNVIPCVLVRFHGCNLQCKQCDVEYAVTGDYDEMLQSEIFDAIDSYKCNTVRIEGGEPLLDEEVVEFAIEASKRYDLQLQTNGSISLEEFIEGCEEARTGRNVSVTLDWKCPSRGESDKMVEGNLDYLLSTDILKFVISCTDDLDYIEDLLGNHMDLECSICISPIWGNIAIVEILEYAENNLNNVTLRQDSRDSNLIYCELVKDSNI